MLKTTNLIGFGGGVSDTGPQTVALSSNDWDYQFDTGNEHPVAGNPLGDHTIGAYFKATGDGNNISTLITLDGDFDITFTLTETNQSEFGVYAIDEDGTRTTDQRAGMSSMTNSFWYRDESVTDFAIGSSYQSDTHTFADGSVVKIERRLGTIKVYDDDVLVHTYGTTYSGTMRFAKGDPGPAEADFDNFLIYDYSKVQRDGMFDESGTDAGFNFGDAITNARNVAQRWQATRSGTITEVKFKVGAHVANFDAVAKLYSDDGTSPASQIGSDSAALTLSSTGVKTLDCSGKSMVVKKGTSYWMVLSDSTADGSGDVDIREQTGDPLSPVNGAGYHDTITSITDSASHGVGVEIAIDTSAGEPTPDHDTLLLIHSNTTNGSTSFSDSSQFGHTVTPRGHSQHKTDQSKFGSTSIYFDGTGDDLVIADNTLWDIEDKSFTVDFWAYNVTGNASVCVAIGPWGYGTCLGVGYNNDTNLVCYASSSGGSWNILAAFSLGAIPGTNWVHYALVRSGNVFKGYRNGVEQSTTTSSSSINTSTGGITIGGEGDPSQLVTGHLDEIRISRVARWDANFTPPTSAYS